MYVMELRLASLRGQQIIAIDQLAFLGYLATGVGAIATLIYSFCIVLSFKNREAETLMSYTPREFSLTFYMGHYFGLGTTAILLLLFYKGLNLLPASLNPFTHESYIQVMVTLAIGLVSGVFALTRIHRLHREALP